MGLATRFANRHRQAYAYPGSFLSRIDLEQRMPTAFAQAAHDSRSERYTCIPTHVLIDRFEAEGWRPTFAVQSIARDETRQGFAKHLLRFRRVDALQREHVPELVLLNSHDGSTSYQLLAGIFRILCTNGLVVGDDITDIRIPHRGNVINAVLEGAETVRSHFDDVLARVDDMRALNLSYDERRAFAAAAVQLRFDSETTEVDPNALLARRRLNDGGTDLWTTYNIVQENVIRGGVQVRSRQQPARLRSARTIRGVIQNVGLNQALWTLASRMQELKSSPVTAMVSA